MIAAAERSSRTRSSERWPPNSSSLEFLRLRRYENQGILHAQRSATGQRLFEASAIAQVRYIRELLDAGLPVRVIRELIDCIHEPGRVEPCAVPILVEHLRAYDARIAALCSNRASLQGLIDASSPTIG